MNFVMLFLLLIIISCLGGLIVAVCQIFAFMIRRQKNHPHHPDNGEKDLEYDSNGIAYAKLDNGCYYVAGKGSCTETDITIHSTLNDIPVTEIGYKAFENRTSMTSVVLPASIIKIQSFAFAGCQSLKSVNIPKSVISIGSNSFRECKALESILLPSVLTKIGNNAFSGTALIRILIPDGVTYIGGYAFYNCTSLEKIEFGNSVAAIGDYAFTNCRRLSEIVLSASIKTIGDNAFENISPECRIYYRGSEEEYKQIDLGNNPVLSDVIYDYAGEKKEDA